MTTKNGDMPAMPVIIKDEEFIWCEGLTKRERFAMAAMQGLLSTCDKGDVSHGGVAWDAVQCADALLAELENTK